MYNEPIKNIMKKSLIKLFFKSFILLLVIITSDISANPKFDKWQNPSFFRGYNVLYESPKSLQDFIDFKNYGGNLFHIQPDGFLACDMPYGIVQENIDGCDMLVNFCRQAGIHYVIGMRSGPGAYDTYDESQGTTGESRVWNSGNTAEQDKYAEMLNMVVQRYAGDTLFVGINLMIEPRPKVRSIPANTSSSYKFFLENVFNIHMDEVYTSWINTIREVDSELPVIIENFAYSTPELFPGYVIDDPYIVYSAHNYQPVEYSKEEIPFSMFYPGTYWNITTLSQVLYNAEFMRNTVFAKLREFQLSTGSPVFIGEMGMYKPQNGGVEFLGDQLDIIKDYGWHFAFWDWRRGPGADWNIEKFGDSDDLNWKRVLSEFHAPPVPALLSPENEELVSSSPSFVWDSLTSFTLYDLEISLVRGSRENIFIIPDINSAGYTFGENIFIEGESYSWRVRAKNPGGMPENKSEWSDPFMFTVAGVSADKKINENNPLKFSLSQNYPNPFNPATTINYSLAKNSNVKIKIFDILGRENALPLNSVKNAGNHSCNFNASELSSGIYIYRIEAIPLDGSAVYTETKKMILLK